jgi:H+/Cl- antiporter ClcA
MRPPENKQDRDDVLQFSNFSEWTYHLKINKEKIMSTRSNTTLVYIVIAVVIIIVAFLLLGGGPWMKGMMHESGSIGTVHLNWVQILISLVIGFLLGLVVARKKW